jgi:hypothetical protein
MTKAEVERVGAKKLENGKRVVEEATMVQEVKYHAKGNGYISKLLLFYSKTGRILGVKSYCYITYNQAIAEVEEKYGEIDRVLVILEGDMEISFSDFKFYTTSEYYIL